MNSPKVQRTHLVEPCLNSDLQPGGQTAHWARPSFALYCRGPHATQRGALAPGSSTGVYPAAQRSHLCAALTNVSSRHSHCEISNEPAGDVESSPRIVAHETQLPASIQSGGHIAIHDAGAYTLAMFSKYNSRQAPPVYGFTDGGATIRLLSDGETIEQALSMWQLPGESHGGGRWRSLAVAAAIGALLAVALVRKV